MSQQMHWAKREGMAMIVASEEVEFIGGGPLDGAVQRRADPRHRITHYCTLEDARTGFVLCLEAHHYVRYGPRSEGGSYYRYLGVER